MLSLFTTFQKKNHERMQGVFAKIFFRMIDRALFWLKCRRVGKIPKCVISHTCCRKRMLNFSSQETNALIIRMKYFHSANFAYFHGH